MKKKLLYIVSIFYIHIMYTMDNNINDNNPILTCDQFLSNDKEKNKVHFKQYIQNIDNKYKEGSCYKDKLKDFNSDHYNNYINKQVCLMQEVKLILLESEISSYEVLKRYPLVETTVQKVLNELYLDIEKSYYEENSDRAGTFGVYHTSHMNMMKREAFRDLLVYTLPYQISFAKDKERLHEIGRLYADELNSKGDKVIGIGEETVRLLHSLFDSNGKILGENGLVDKKLLLIKKMLLGQENGSVKETLEKMIDEIEKVLDRKIDAFDKLIDVKIDKFNNLFFEKTIELLKISVVTCSALYFIQKLYAFSMSYFFNNDDSKNSDNINNQKKKKIKKFLFHGRESGVFASNLALCVLSVIYTINKTSDLLN